MELEAEHKLVETVDVNQQVEIVAEEMMPFLLIDLSI